MSRSHQTKSPPDPSLPANGFPPPAPFPPPPDSLNGHAPRAVPPRAGRRGGWVWYAAAAAGLVALAAGIAAVVHFRPAPARADVLTHKVKRENLDVTVTEKGTLESANNIDVTCKVRAGAKGFASTINWVIDDGSKVKKDQILMVLDDSALQDQLRAQKIAVAQALSLKVAAELAYDIADEEGKRAVAEQQNVLLGATLDLEKFLGLSFDPAQAPAAAVVGAAATLTEGGDYKRQVDDLTGQVRMAESDLEQNRERSAWADRMVKMKYMSPAQAQAERSKLDSSAEKLRTLQSQKGLLLAYDRKKLLADFRSKVDNARRMVRQKELEAEANEKKAKIDRQTKVSIYDDECEKLRDFEAQIKECRIHAPQDGMVVYFKSESGRFGSSPQNMIEQGAQVKEGQKLLRIPNLDRMQVNTKVHEAMFSRIQGDVRIATNFVDLLRVGMLANPDPFTRLIGQKDDVMQELRDAYRQKEYRTASRGQPATVRVDSMREVTLKGRVRSIAQVASQADAWMSDIKLFPTIVLIEERVEGLKPDMSAEVTIHVNGIPNVLTVPLQAVVGGADMGAKRKVFVKTEAGGYDERDVTLGLFNEKMVEVKDGLAEGDEVVINPKVLLGDNKQKTRDAGGAAPGDGGKGSDGKGAPAAGDKAGWDPSKKKGGGGTKGGPPQG